MARDEGGLEWGEATMVALELALRSRSRHTRRRRRGLQERRWRRRWRDGRSAGCARRVIALSRWDVEDREVEEEDKADSGKAGR